MGDDAKWVRPAFLSLAALFGLIVMVWGLITGAMGGFHIYEPRYGRAASDQGDVASAFRSVYSPLLELGVSQGTAPPGSEDALRRAAADAEEQALVRAKDQAYNDAVKGAIAFVAGGFVLMVASSGAKRVAARASRPASIAESGSPVPAASAARPAPVPPASAPQARTRVSAPPPAGRAVGVPPRPAAASSTSPVGSLQEAPESVKTRPAVRKAPAPVPVAPRPPVPRRAPKPEESAPAETGESTGAPKAASDDVAPARPIAPPPPASAPAVQPPAVAARPLAPPAFRPAQPPPPPATEPAPESEGSTE